MGRRRFLEALSALGLSTQAVQGMSREKLQQLTGDPTDEVPVVDHLRAKNIDKNRKTPPNKPLERETVYYTVPRDRWVRMQSAYDAAERVRQKIDKELDVSERITTGVTRTVRGHSRKYTVSIEIDHSEFSNRTGLTPFYSGVFGSASPERTLDKLKGIIPDEVYGQADMNKNSMTASVKNVDDPSRFGVDNIPVEYEFKRSVNDCTETECCDFYDRKYRIDSGGSTRIPTGAQFSPKINGEWSDSVSTLGPRIYDTDTNSYGFVTTAHSGLRQSEDDALLESVSSMQGRPIAQPDTSRVGKIVRGVHWRAAGTGFPQDAMVIDTDSEYLAATGLAAKGANEMDVIYGTAAILGRDRLRDLEKEKGTLLQQGARTGRCREVIYKINPHPSGDEIVLNRDYDDGGGNSGGPYLGELKNSDTFVAAGIHQRGGARTREFPGEVGEFETDVSEGMYIGDVENVLSIRVQ